MEHRDIKSANVLLVIHRGELRAKLCDFGLSRVRVRDTTNRTTKGGTTRWRGPELYDIPATISSPAVLAVKFSEKSDVWAYGMFLFEILTTLVRFFFFFITAVDLTYHFCVI